MSQLEDAIAIEVPIVIVDGARDAIALRSIEEEFVTRNAEIVFLWQDGNGAIQDIIGRDDHLVHFEDFAASQFGDFCVFVTWKAFGDNEKVYGINFETALNNLGESSTVAIWIMIAFVGKNNERF